MFALWPTLRWQIPFPRHFFHPLAMTVSFLLRCFFLAFSTTALPAMITRYKAAECVNLAMAQMYDYLQLTAINLEGNTYAWPFSISCVSRQAHSSLLGVIKFGRCCCCCCWPSIISFRTHFRLRGYGCIKEDNIVSGRKETWLLGSKKVIENQICHSSAWKSL